MPSNAAIILFSVGTPTPDSHLLTSFKVAPVKEAICLLDKPLSCFSVVNKFEKPRSEDALRDVRKQYRRNHQLFEGHEGSPKNEDLPIFGTMASQLFS